MAISRHDYVSQNQILDTYVPPPFKEMQEALNRKQLEYDKNEALLSSSDSEIQGLLPKVKPTYRDSKDVENVNPYYEAINQTNSYLANKKTKLIEEYGKDYTTPEAKKAISQYAREASALYNDLAPYALESDKNYESIRKKLEDYKGEKQGQAFIEADNQLYNFLNSVNKGSKSVLGSTNVGEYIDYQKKQDDFLTKIKPDSESWAKSGVVPENYQRESTKTKISEISKNKIENSFLPFYEQEILPSVSKSIEYQIFHDMKNGVSSYPVSFPVIEQIKDKNGKLTEVIKKDKNGNYIYEKKELSPKEYKNLLLEQDKASRIQQAHRYITKDIDRDKSSSALSKFDLARLGLGEDGQPIVNERSTQVGGEVTGDQQIDFTKSPNKLSDLFLSSSNKTVNDLYEGKYKDRTSPTRYGVLGDPYLMTPEKAVSHLEKLKNSGRYKSLESTIDEDIKTIKPLADKIKAEKTLKEKADKGDIESLHDYYESTNPVYKNVSDAYKSRFNRTNLSKEDKKAIQQRANLNLQTVQGNQEVTLNPKYDAEALQNVAGSVLNGNAVIKNDAGEVLNPKDIIPDYAGKTPEEIINYIKGGITTYITPVGRKEAGYKATINGENYNITYPNSAAVPELRKFKETISNIFDVNLPSKQEVQAPDKIQQSIRRSLSKNNIQPEFIKYISNRDDWNIDNSTLIAEVYYKDDSGRMARTTMDIPVFGGEISVTRLATSINPQTGQDQDMLKYTIKDSESTKNIPLE